MKETESEGGIRGWDTVFNPTVFIYDPYCSVWENEQGKKIGRLGLALCDQILDYTHKSI